MTREVAAADFDEPLPLFALPGDRPRIGSLFSGYGGLEMGVQATLGGSLAWHSEIDPGASAILATHWPDVPNLGDITAVDWGAVEPVDIVTGGFPCTDVSAAGRRDGLRPGTRSGLWAHMAYAIEMLRPRLVVIENVRGLLSSRGAPKTGELLAAEAERDRVAQVLRLIESKLERAVREGKREYVVWHRRDRVRLLRRFKRAVAACKRADARIVRAIGTVLGDLARLGFDARWCGVRASDVGAPHARFRVFICAWPAADSDCGELQRWGVGGVLAGAAGAESGEGLQRQRPGDSSGHRGATVADPERDRRAGRHPGGAGGSVGPEVARTPVAGCGAASADPDSVGSVRGGRARGRRGGSPDDDRAAANTASDGWNEGRPEPTGDPRRPEPAGGRGEAAPDAHSWGVYEPAIRRWEMIVGREAPAPTVIGAKGGRQLSAHFVEFLIGLPEGHVTGVAGLSRNDQLRALGNGVVPAQAAAAIHMLLAAASAEVAA